MRTIRDQPEDRLQALERYAVLGLAGLEPRSHRPHRCPQRTDEAVAALIRAERQQHRTWGPKKLQAVLERKHGIESPPACSTIAEILRRHGLSVRRRRRPGAFAAGNAGLTVPTQPNHVWTVDFKGWFLLGDGQRCDPLLVCDRYSRYLRRPSPTSSIKARSTPFAPSCATTAGPRLSAAISARPSPPSAWAASPA